MLLDHIHSIPTLESPQGPRRLLAVHQIERTLGMLGAVVPRLAPSFEMDDLRISDGFSQDPFRKHSFAATGNHEVVHHVPLGMQRIAVLMEDSVHGALVAPMHQFRMFGGMPHHLRYTSIFPEES